MKAIRTLLAVLLMGTSMGLHADDDALRHTTDVMCLLPDATALGMAIAKHDTEGLKQLGLSTATCLAVNYGLEFCIRKDRRDFGEYARQGKIQRTDDPEGPPAILPSEGMGGGSFRLADQGQLRVGAADEVQPGHVKPRQAFHLAHGQRLGQNYQLQHMLLRSLPKAQILRCAQDDRHRGSVSS